MIHERGFALCSMRSKSRSRYYLQCSSDENIEDWPDDKFWEELTCRLDPEINHALGLPVLRALSLCTCCRHYPGAAAGRRLRSSHPAVTAFPDNVVGSACTSSFSRPAQRSLALRPAHSRGHLYVTSYTEGFSHFVTSMTAPVASGWSGWPGGACTHWKAPPCHGAHVKRTFWIGVVAAACVVLLHLISAPRKPLMPLTAVTSTHDG